MELNFEFKLDDFQQEAVEHISNGKSVVLCAPTGAGKTVIAEAAIQKALIEGKKLFYTTPLKALSNQKFRDFSAKYGEEIVGLLTGDTSINRKAQIVVMTTEVYRNMLYGTSLGSLEENLKNVQYVVLDEVHYMNDEQRGTVWEESIIYSPNNIQLVALSATVANSQELTDWINTVHGKTELVYTDFRPVPLRHYYYSPKHSQDIIPLLTPEGKLNRKIKAEGKDKKRFNRQRNENPVVGVVKSLHQKDMLPAIYFTFSRRKCDESVEKCMNLRLLNNFEEKRIVQIIDEYVLENPLIGKSAQLEFLYSGVASHHAGHLPAWKTLVEKLFAQGLIKVVFATETLAAGINMPARSTVISSISKRCDNGHRILTPSEFLQMSGRAGRRGMDKVGHVTIVGTAFQEPHEVAELATSDANPLESRFSPSYSMVLNLLQRFSLDESRELILKSFGYFSSTERLKPLLKEKKRIQKTIDYADNFKCPHSLELKDILEYNKFKNMYVENRNIFKTLRRQAKNAGKKSAPEVKEFEKKVKELLHKMQKSRCDNCKLYKKHIKEVETKSRFERKLRKIELQIEIEKDVYWNNFLNYAAILEQMEYLEDNYPKEKGITTAAIRAENELFFAEVIFSGVLNNLMPSELAGVLCAISTEEIRGDIYIPVKLSPSARKAINDIEKIMRRIKKIQNDHDVETPLYVNPILSAVVEYWANGADWEAMTNNMNVAQGDLVRAFKRTIDLLRQLTIIPNVPQELAQSAGIALDNINREPINDEF